MSGSSLWMMEAELKRANELRTHSRETVSCMQTDSWMSFHPVSVVYNSLAGNFYLQVLKNLKTSTEIKS